MNRPPPRGILRLWLFKVLSPLRFQRKATQRWQILRHAGVLVIQLTTWGSIAAMTLLPPAHCPRHRAALHDAARKGGNRAPSLARNARQNSWAKCFVHGPDGRHHLSHGTSFSTAIPARTVHPTRVFLWEGAEGTWRDTFRSLLLPTFFVEAMLGCQGNANVPPLHMHMHAWYRGAVHMQAFPARRRKTQCNCH